MPWVKLDDHFAQHPKVAAAGPLAMAMQVAALSYCNRELTDGFVPKSVARTLIDCDPEAGISVTCSWVIARLIDYEMWEAVDGGYCIHDYHDYQPTREEALALREKRAEAGRVGGLQRAAHIKEANVANPKQSAKQNPSKTLANPLAKPKQNPNPVPVSRIPLTVDPIPEPEPRETPALASAEVATPYRFVEILCEATSRDITKLTTREKNYSLAVAKRLIDDEVTCAEVRGFVGYLQAEHWRTGPITMKTVEDGIGTWRASGAPAMPSRASPPTNGRATLQDFLDLVHGEESNEPAGDHQIIVDPPYAVSDGQALGAGGERHRQGVGHDPQRR